MTEPFAALWMSDKTFVRVTLKDLGVEFGVWRDVDSEDLEGLRFSAKGSPVERQAALRAARQRINEGFDLLEDRVNWP